ncbi:MAG TPA: ribonuclease R [Tepidisphaeraceae bacterium]|jgi:ribonuclease R
MAADLQTRILDYLKSPAYRPQKARPLARALELHDDEQYPAFKEALDALLESGQVIVSKGRNLTLPEAKQEAAPAPATAGAPPVAPAAPAKRAFPEHPPLKEPLPRGIVIGSYRHHRRGFGFVIPTEPAGHEDLFIPEGQNAGAITDDIVRAKVTGSEQREGRTRYEGRIMEVVTRTNNRFVGSLVKQGGQWMVLPDGNDFTDPILTPDAASRHIKVGTKVVVELTQYPEEGRRAEGVITEALGTAGEKDVDLRTVIISHNLPGEFPEECKQQARAALDRFNASLDRELATRLDLSNEVIATIDPDDAKDYDDAISLRRLKNGNWQLGVHIADVSFFVEPESPLDEEAAARGNSAYFPGHVIPMLPEVLSNGVCSLQEGVARLCKSAFIELDQDANPVGTKFQNTVIKSRKRLRYKEAQAILDGVKLIPHPDGPQSVETYDPEVLELLRDMNELAGRIQKRRHKAGQLVLGLPEVDLVLDEEGKVIGAVPEDESYTHTIIEMFMVEANEAVARLLNSVDVPFLRRIHPVPETETHEKLRAFVQVAGYRLPKIIDRHALQALLETVKGKPEAFAVNLAVLKSLKRAEYSPQPVGHYALASEQYCHFTSPIRRYADLTVHRLLDSYFAARQDAPRGEGSHSRKQKLELENVIPYQELVELGKHISFTERRADEAERELREIKILELLANRIGDVFHGVVTSITKFGIFIQLQEYLIDGLIRYEQLMDDYWQVDDRAGIVRGRRTGQTIAVGDLADVLVVNVDVPRRELTLAIAKLKKGGPKRAPGNLPAPEEKKSRRRPARDDREKSRPRARAGKPGAKRGGGGRR